MEQTVIIYSTIKQVRGIVDKLRDYGYNVYVSSSDTNVGWINYLQITKANDEAFSIDEAVNIGVIIGSN